MKLDFVDGRFEFLTRSARTITGPEELTVTDSARAALATAPDSPLTEDEVECALLERELLAAKFDGTVYNVQWFEILPSWQQQGWRYVVSAFNVNHFTDANRLEAAKEALKFVRALRAERAAQQEQEQADEAGLRVPVAELDVCDCRNELSQLTNNEVGIAQSGAPVCYIAGERYVMGEDETLLQYYQRLVVLAQSDRYNLRAIAEKEAAAAQEQEERT